MMIAYNNDDRTSPSVEIKSVHRFNGVSKVLEYEIWFEITKKVCQVRIAFVGIED